MTGAVLTQAHNLFTIETPGVGFTDLTDRVSAWLREAGTADGLLTLFIRHTSASLTIQENADPDVLADLADSLTRLAPATAKYRHTIEGPDDMPAHIKSMLTATSLQVPVIGGAIALGTWQALYLIEHRTQPHRREVVAVFQGTKR